MNWRYTLALAVIAVLVSVFAFSQRKAEPLDVGKGTATTTPGPLVALEPSDVQEVSVVGATGQYTLTRVAGGWQVDGETAKDEVDGVVEGLAAMSVLGEPPLGAKPEHYGFATPTLTVTLKTAAGEKRVIQVGDPVPTQYGAVYVRLQDEARIIYVSDVQTSQLETWLTEKPVAPTPTPTPGTPTPATEVPAAEEGTPVLGPGLPPSLDTVLPPAGATPKPTSAPPTAAATTAAEPTAVPASPTTAAGTRRP